MYKKDVSAAKANGAHAIGAFDGEWGIARPRPQSHDGKDANERKAPGEVATTGAAAHRRSRTFTITRRVKVPNAAGEYELAALKRHEDPEYMRPENAKGRYGLEDITLTRNARLEVITAGSFSSWDIVLPHELRAPDNGSRLSERTRVKGHYETALKGLLLDLGIRANYEPFAYVAGDLRFYVPDFTIDLFMDGRRVVLERHNVVIDVAGGDSMNFISKAANFISNHADGLYFILLDSQSGRPKSPTFDLQPRHPKAGIIYAHEHWHLPKIRLDRSGSPNKGDIGRWTGDVRLLLQGLIERSRQVKA